jgi:predicted nucleic acid-binding protein
VRLFLDTSAFVALEDLDDANHKGAIEFRERIRKGETPYRTLYTSNYITDEAMTVLRFYCGHNVAASFRSSLEKSKSITVLWVTEALENAAWRMFEKRADKDYSFTDCTSFALMDAEAIRNVFAFDEDFLQEGYNLVP